MTWVRMGPEPPPAFPGGTDRRTGPGPIWSRTARMWLRGTRASAGWRGGG